MSKLFIPPTNLPRGRLTSAVVIANQTGISAITDLTGLTISWTGVAGRWYRVTAKVELTATAADGAFVLSMTDGSNILVQRAVRSCTADATTTTIELIEQITGAVTRKLRLAKSGGTGTVGLQTASATIPAFILVEDIGV